MIAVCYAKSDKKITIRQPRVELMPVHGGDPLPRKKPGIEIQFDRVAATITDPFQESVFSPRNNRNCAVWGTLSIEDQARKTGLSTTELVYWMLHHPSYNTDRGFLIFHEDGRKVESLDDYVLHKKNDDESDHTWYCIVCDKEMDVRGKGGHREAPAHKDALAAYGSTVRNKILNLGKDHYETSSVAYL